MTDTSYIEQLNKKAWENVTNTFSLYRDKLTVTPLFINFIKQISAHSTVLDLGCGTGLPFGKYITDNNHTLEGIDFSRSMIEKAKLNVPKGNFRVQSIDQLSTKNFYEGIVASYSLQLLAPDIIRDVVFRCSRALKQKGIMYVSLNEPVINRSDYIVFMGEKMFFKDYSEKDLINIFSEKGMEKIYVQRTVEESETFGKEYMIEIIFQKKSLA